MAALESQGARLRRASSVSVNYETTAGLQVAAATTNICSTHATADMVTAGVTTGMRLVLGTTTGACLTTRVLTVKTVAGTVLTVHEAVTNNTGTGLYFDAYTMQDIGLITGWNGPSRTISVVDLTNLLSTAREKLPLTHDSGQVSIDLLWQVTAADSTYLHYQLREDMQARTLRRFDVLLTDEKTSAATQPSAYFFKGYVTGYNVNAAVDNVMKGSLTIDLSSMVHEIPKV